MAYKDKICYDELVRSALIGVVKSVLKDVERNGQKGGHHHYITFATNHKKAEIPDYLLKQYPEEIIIILQHEFTNLKVNDSYFEVELVFENKNEKIRVPFSSLINFYDPSVKFGLQFIPDYDEPTDDNDAQREVSEVKKDDAKKDVNSTYEKVISLDELRQKKNKPSE